MTLATQEEIVDAEVVLTDSEAEDFDARFQVALGTYAEARQELIDCVEFVRNTDIAERMGFKSRGDYIADRVAGLNVKWAVEDRRSLVELMAYDENGGMSNPQIGRALGVDQSTVYRDTQTFADANVERKVQSSDGKTRTYGPKPEPTVSERDWPVVPEPTPEELFQRLEKVRAQNIADGISKPPRTREEREADGRAFVESLIGKAERQAEPATPEDKFAKALNAVGAAIRINHGVNEAALNEDGWNVLRALGLR